MRLDESMIAAIEAVLARDQRVELIPTRDGVRIICIRRTEVKPDYHDRKRPAGRTESG